MHSLLIENKHIFCEILNKSYVHLSSFNTIRSARLFNFSNLIID